jgi:hypothetical protein
VLEEWIGVVGVRTDGPEAEKPPAKPMD